MARLLMLSAERVRRTIVRLAYEIIEDNRGAGNLVLVGIQRGGVDLAHALAKNIEVEVPGNEVEVRDLDVTPFRDDRDRTASSQVNVRNDLVVTDKHVILVDDVLFTGRTARAAMDAIVNIGRPKTIQLAVLIDRGHRELPIEPTFVGKSIKTKHKERVVVEVDNAGFSVFVEE